MNYDLMNGRLKYITILKKRIEYNNLDLNITKLWEAYYHITPPYSTFNKLQTELIEKERKVFNKCVQHIDDIILKNYDKKVR